MNKQPFWQGVNENKLRITLGLSLAIHTSVLFSFQMQAPGSRLRTLQTTIELTDIQEQFSKSPEPREVIKRPSHEPAEESVEQSVEQKVAIPSVPQKQVFLPFYKVETLPDFRYRVMPVYPEQARKLGRQSQVILEAYIDAEGIVRKIRVLRSGGEYFDQAAIAALQNSKFKPARIMGRSVPVKIRIPYSFSLEK